MRFTPLGHRRIEANFDGGRLTSDAGFLLLREVDRRLGLLDAINHIIADPRDPTKIGHEQCQRLAQRIMALAPRYEDLNAPAQRREWIAAEFPSGAAPC